MARAANKRLKGLPGVVWACLETAASGRREHRPTSADYPDTLVKRISFTAGGGLGWRISALATPRATPAPWKIVVITGAPSWAEYWAPVMAALPADREMIVVDRPGYGLSEPADCVPDIRVQARALAPVLKRAAGQKILLVGQSYGAAIATLMAEARPGAVSSLLLLSSYLGVCGPTARWLVETGTRVRGLIPRDLRHAVQEVTGQAAQLPLMRAALERLRAPVHVIHGDADDFAPLELARALAAETRTRQPIRFAVAAGVDHFITDGPAEALLSHLDACLPRPKPAFAFRWPRWPVFVGAATGTGGAAAAV